MTSPQQLPQEDTVVPSDLDDAQDEVWEVDLSAERLLRAVAPDEET